MPALEQFTCVSYDNLDLLIPNSYVKMAYYAEASEDKNSVNYDSEILPHLNFLEFIQEKFCCRAKGTANSALIINAADWNDDIRKKISERTDTAFPKSGTFALSFGTGISNNVISAAEFSFFPGEMQNRLQKHGIAAIRFLKETEKKERIQLLVGVDFLMYDFLQE